MLQRLRAPSILSLQRRGRSRVREYDVGEESDLQQVLEGRVMQDDGCETLMPDQWN